MIATANKTLSVSLGEIMNDTMEKSICEAIALQADAQEIMESLQLGDHTPMTEDESWEEDSLLGSTWQDRSFATQMLVDRSKRSKSEWRLAQKCQPVTLIIVRLPHKTINLPSEVKPVEDKTVIYGKAGGVAKMACAQAKVPFPGVSIRIYVTGTTLVWMGQKWTVRDDEIWLHRPKGAFRIGEKLGAKMLERAFSQLNPQQKRAARKAGRGLNGLWAVLKPMAPTTCQALVTLDKPQKSLTPEWCKARLEELGESTRIGTKKRGRDKVIETGWAEDSKGRGHAKAWKIVKENDTPPEVAAYLEFVGDIQSGRLDPEIPSQTTLEWEQQPGDNRRDWRAEHSSLDVSSEWYEAAMTRAENEAWREMNKEHISLPDKEEDYEARMAEWAALLPVFEMEEEEKLIERQEKPHLFLEEAPDDKVWSF
jgi:hypothetical protein